MNIGKICLTRSVIKGIQRVWLADKGISCNLVTFNTLVSLFLGQVFEFFRILGIFACAIFGGAVTYNTKEVLDMRPTIFIIDIIGSKDFLALDNLGVGYVVLNSTVWPCLSDNTTDISCVFDIKNTLGY